MNLRAGPYSNFIIAYIVRHCKANKITVGNNSLAANLSNFRMMFSQSTALAALPTLYTFAKIFYNIHTGGRDYGKRG